jgi:hypothetical protein|tara:strand:- start:943 stop:2001 length:1059 start_codon:yes stop_codon:yes gene_type:complete
MKLSTAKNIVKRAIKAQLDLAKNPDASESRAIVPYLQGKVGIGKSSTVHQAAFELSKELGIKIYVQMISLAQYDPAEIAGWLLPNDDKTAMIRIKPDWLEPEGDYDVIVYFFDELPQAIVANQNIAGQVFQEKRIGSFRLPVNSALVAAGNRTADRAGTNPIPSQLKDRLAFLNMTENLNDTVAHFIEKMINEKIVAFLAFKPDLLHQFNPDEDVFPTPRAWERVSEVLSWGLPALEERETLNGIIGSVATTEFYAFLAVYDVIPNIDDLIKNPMSAIIPDRADVVYAVCASLGAKANPDNIGNIIKYIGRLDADEYGAFVIKGAISKIPNPRQNKHLREWAENGGGAELLL